jgi:POT family proton-dependent oligopeptide transporter
MAGPAGMLSMIMGVWFAATLPGDILAGWLGGFWMTFAKTDFFLLIASVATLAGIAIWCISGWVSSVLDAKTDM